MSKVVLFVGKFDEKLNRAAKAHPPVKALGAAYGICDDMIALTGSVNDAKEDLAKAPDPKPVVETFYGKRFTNWTGYDRRQIVALVTTEAQKAELAEFIAATPRFFGNVPVYVVRSEGSSFKVDEMK